MSARTKRSADRRTAVGAYEGWHRPAAGLALVAAVAAAIIVGVIALPRETAALPDIARHAMRIALPRWGTTEGVNEVVYGSRGFDTFGETFLLLAAVVAVIVLSRGPEPRAEYVGESTAGKSEQQSADRSPEPDEEEQVARRAESAESEETRAPDHADSDPLGQPGPERSAGMTVVIRVAARTAAVPLAVAGVYQAAWGYTPGGGFPAGVVLTGVALLLYTGLGHRAVGRGIRPAVMEPIELVGAVGIVALGVIGVFIKGSFMQNWLPLGEQQTILAGGTGQAFSIAELIEVATGLTIAIFALLGMRHDWAPDEQQESPQ